MTFGCTQSIQRHTKVCCTNRHTHETYISITINWNVTAKCGHCHIHRNLVRDKSGEHTHTHTRHPTQPGLRNSAKEKEKIQLIFLLFSVLFILVWVHLAVAAMAVMTHHWHVHSSICPVQCRFFFIFFNNHKQLMFSPLAECVAYVIAPEWVGFWWDTLPARTHRIAHRTLSSRHTHRPTSIVD